MTASPTADCLRTGYNSLVRTVKASPALYAPAGSVTSARNMVKSATRDRISRILCILHVTTYGNAVKSATRDTQAISNSLWKCQSGVAGVLCSHSGLQSRFVTFIVTCDIPQNHMCPVSHVTMPPSPPHRHTPSTPDLTAGHISNDDDFHKGMKSCLVVLVRNI